MTQGTSVVFLTAFCVLLLIFCAVCNLYSFSYFYSSSAKLAASYFEIVAHSAEYKCLIVSLLFPTSVFGVEITF